MAKEYIGFVVPEELSSKIKRRIGEANFASISEYIRALIRKDVQENQSGSGLGGV